MANSAAAVQTLQPATGWNKIWLNIKRNWQLHLFVFLPMLYILIFHYIPLYGLQIAFKDYSPRLGIWDSPWVGLEHYKNFFGYFKWTNLVVNTLALSLYSIVVGFPLPIILALVLHVNTNKVLKKVAQNISYMPHFISLVVMVGILNTVLNPVSGLLGAIYRLLGVVGYDDIRGSSEAFRHLYTWSGIWQSTGWGAIMYVSALSAVPDELHEAAKLDGASRLRRVWSVDLPTIMPTIAIMLIMRFGSIMSVGYQKVYLMQNEMNLTTSDVISTYVYREGIKSGEMSFGTAISILNTIINTALIYLVNGITNAITDNEMGLF